MTRKLSSAVALGLRRRLPALGSFASAVAIAVAILVPTSAPAQPGASRPRVPFAVGEELTYRATFGGINAGTAKLRVASIDTVRGRLAYHLLLTIEGGIPGFRVRDRYDSWIDIETLSSLRYVQQISEGSYQRHTSYEIYPDRLQYQKNSEPILPTVARPLDEVAFIYAVRASGIPPGTSQALEYFKPEGNPVTLTSISVDTVTVRAGTFVTTAVRPSIRTAGLFAENTDARIWFSKEPYLYPVRIRTKFALFTVTLTLESITKE